MKGDIFMLKIAMFLSGLGLMIIGVSSYFAGIPLIIDCNSIVCTIGTTLITLDMVVMGVGLLFILISMLFIKTKK